MSLSSPADHSVATILNARLFGALPAFAMLVLIAVADLALDGTAVIVIVGCAVVGMFAGDALLSRTATGLAQRSAHERIAETFSEHERRVHVVAQWLPVGVALIVGVLTDTGTGAVALGLVVGFAAAQVAFAVWLHGRRNAFSPAAGS